TALAASAEGGATTTRRGTHLAPTTPSADTAERGAAAPQGDAETGSHLATVGSRRAARAATDEAPGDDGSADGDGDTPSTPAAAGPSATTRELPAGVRASSEPLQALAGRAHEPSPADAGARSDALGIVRSDATAQGGSSEGSTRLRASGFGDGAAGLPSWVERLASPDGLAATRRGNALHLDLEPNGLGRIEVRLSFGRDGVRASLLTEHEHTRTLLASQQPQLAAALERNDLRLESLLVDVGAQSGGDGRQASRDAGEATAFDQIGLVHVSEPESAASEVSVVPGLATRGLVNVRA
ncbi:flagellar hook-length control protein FliK, partial [Candidatus Binatia bacterium]|nr:flagellar hook-length control protein FliK [Candidatus Binatia bacterium]